MSRVTKEINRISIMVIGLSGRLIAYAFVLVLLIFGIRRAYEFGHSIFYSPGMEEKPGTEKTVTISGEESIAEVGQILEDAGLIRDSLAFTIQAMVYEYDVQAGTYELNTSESSKEIIKILKNAPAEETEAAE